MEISRKTGQHLLMGTGLMLIIPMFVFPRQFGTELANPALVNLGYELVFYGLVLYFYHRQTTLAQLFKSAGLCLVYRLALGLLLGIAISVSYSMKFSVSFQLAMSSYLPAILFQIVLTPLVMRSAVLPILGADSMQPRHRRQGRLEIGQEASGTSVAISVSQGVVMSQPESAAPPKPSREPISKQMSPAQNAYGSANGFDRAVRYIGEHGSVYMAAVVDHEGLLLAQFKRGNFLPEDYAPLAQLLTEDNSRLLSRRGFNFSELERIDLGLKEERLVICKHDFCTLVVIAERQSDDLLNIRINQGMDTIAKYVEERFPRTATSNVENKYVPGTE